MERKWGEMTPSARVDAVARWEPEVLTTQQFAIDSLNDSLIFDSTQFLLDEFEIERERT